MNVYELSFHGAKFRMDFVEADNLLDWGIHMWFRFRCLVEE